MATDPDEFVTAVGPNGQKRRVPKHYLDNPAFGFRLPPSARARTDEEAVAIEQISGVDAPEETAEVDPESTGTDVVPAEPKKEARR